MTHASEQEKRLRKVLLISWLILVFYFGLCRLIAGGQWNGSAFGRNFWIILPVAAFLLAGAFALTVLRVRHGKTSYIYTLIEALHKYLFLMKQLIKRDYKTKYLRYILGVMWSFLNPLLMMMVQYIVFSTLFKNNIPNFAAYLIIGNICFSFFSESCSLTLNSITGNAGLITKVYMPKYKYPFTRTVSSIVNLAIALITMLLVCLITGVRFTTAVFISPYFFLCLFIFSLGMGMLLSCIMVFFRDIQFLWCILVMIWMYFTPIFYSIDIIPDAVRWLFQLNPLYIFISSIRSCIMYGTVPLPGTFLKAAIAALVMMLIGSLVFKKAQDSFVLYL